MKEDKKSQAELILQGLPELAAFLEAFPGFVHPYGNLRLSKFTESLEDFLTVCHYMGEYEQDKVGEHYEAVKYFGPAISIVVYLHEKYLAPKPVVPQELKNWGRKS